MIEHAEHAMHSNSLEAYRSEQQDLGGRSFQIYSLLLSSARPLTDREIARALHYDHRSAVQPRISDLVKAGWVKEVDHVREDESGKPRSVRRVRAVPHDERAQLEMVLST